MKIPETFQIFAQPFSVEYTSDLARDEDKFGWLNLEQGKIAIDGATTDYVKEVTLLHELIHIMEETAGLSLEEFQVDIMAKVLHQYLETSTYKSEAKDED